MTYFHKYDRQKPNTSLLSSKGSQLENVLKQMNKWPWRDETKGLFEQLNHKHSFRHFWTIYGLDENWNEKRSAELPVGVKKCWDKFLDVNTVTLVHGLTIIV